MAKRKRLTPARPDYLSPEGAPAPETKSMFPPAPPIARVAGESAAAAALAEVAGAMEAARAEGRLIQPLPLDAVDESYLVRDRMAADPAEMAELMESLRARGQQTPAEVAELGGGRYGLISGWRRLMALRQLAEETGEARFGLIQCLIRAPGSAAEAYVAMVEENEIRVGLSYFERARIVLRAVEQGVFASDKAALAGLFAAASRARRSKIGGFLPLVAALDGALSAPGAIPERLGLNLGRMLEADPALAPRLRERLRKAEGPEAELAVLTRAAGGKAAAEPVSAGTGTVSPPVSPPAPPPGPLRPVHLQATGSGRFMRITLSGPGVDPAFRDRLEDWLRRRSS